MSETSTQPATHSGDIEFKFQASQKVFCYHGSIIYDARCINTRVEKGRAQYLIHYHGWSKNWDEWVNEDRVLEYNETSKKLCEELKTKSRQSSGGSKGQKRKSMVLPQVMPKGDKPEPRPPGSKEGSVLRSSTTPAGIAVATPGRKSSDAADSGAEKKSNISTKRKSGRFLRNELPEKSLTRYNVDIKIPIPEELQQIIFDDNNNIVNLNMLVDLQNVKCVHDILEAYIGYRLESEAKGTSFAAKEFPKDLKLTKDPVLIDLDYSGLGPGFRKNCYREVADGIEVYFDTVLPTQLLYKFERIQYQELMQNTSGSSCGGSESETNDAMDVSYDLPASRLYGVHHLLRLFTTFSRLLSYFDFDDGFLRLLIFFFSDFLDYLNQNRDHYFSPNHYIAATPDYIRRAV